MTQEYDQEAFTRWFLDQLTAKAPLHHWREVLIPPHHDVDISVIAAIGRGAIWFGIETTFDRLTAKDICRDLQQHLDAMRLLRGENVNDKSC